MARDAIVAKIMVITTWLRRKGYNMKTGERYTAAVKVLLKLITAESPATDFEMPAKGMPSEGSGSGSLPVRRRLTHKVSEESVYSVPGQGMPATGRKLSCQPSEESDEGVLALYGQGRSKPAPLPTKDLEVTSSDDDQAIAGLCEDITKKRPASSQKGSEEHVQAHPCLQASAWQTQAQLFKHFFKCVCAHAADSALDFLTSAMWSNWCVGTCRAIENHSPA